MSACFSYFSLYSGFFGSINDAMGLGGVTQNILKGNVSTILKDLGQNNKNNNRNSRDNQGTLPDPPPPAQLLHLFSHLPDPTITSTIATPAEMRIWMSRQPYQRWGAAL